MSGDDAAAITGAWMSKLGRYFSFVGGDVRTFWDIAQEWSELATRTRSNTDYINAMDRRMRQDRAFLAHDARETAKSLPSFRRPAAAPLATASAPVAAPADVNDNWRNQGPGTATPKQRAELFRGYRSIARDRIAAATERRELSLRAGQVAVYALTTRAGQRVSFSYFVRNSAFMFFESERSLASALRLSTKTIERALAELVNKGWLHPIGRGHKRKLFNNSKIWAASSDISSDIASAGRTEATVGPADQTVGIPLAGPIPTQVSESRDTNVGPGPTLLSDESSEKNLPEIESAEKRAPGAESLSAAARPLPTEPRLERPRTEASQQLSMIGVLRDPRKTRTAPRRRRKTDREMTARNVARYARRAGHFWTFFMRKTGRSPMTSDRLEPFLVEYADEEAARGIARGTITITLYVTINALEELGASVDRKAPGLAAHLGRRVGPVARVLHTHDDLRALLSAAGEDLRGLTVRVAILLPLRIDARPLEMLKLMVQNFDRRADGGMSIARQRGRGGEIEHVAREGGDFCLATAIARLLDALAALGIGAGPIFRSEQTLGRVHGETTLSRMVRDTAQRAAVVNVTSGSLRQSGAQLFPRQAELTGTCD